MVRRTLGGRGAAQQTEAHACKEANCIEKTLGYIFNAFSTLSFASGNFAQPFGVVSYEIVAPKGIL